MYFLKDQERVYSEPATNLEHEEYRTPWRRDYARLIHSPSFRRLQGKTQLFPGQESDFFRNRLTHSIEVAQIAESIAIRINHRYTYSSKYKIKALRGKPVNIDQDIVNFAGLAHDLGHPPFGHQGEEALDECMINEGGFEGNAQTLRLLSRLEKKIIQKNFNNENDERVGLNLTYRSLASILKYSTAIPYTKEQRKNYDSSLKPVKGYYHTELSLVNKIKEKVAGISHGEGNFKTVECMIMDIADDIAYSTYDLEDAFKAGFFTPFDILFADPKIYQKVQTGVSKRLKRAISIQQIKNVVDEIFSVFQQQIPYNKNESNPEYTKAYLSHSAGVAYIAAKEMSSSGYMRTKFTSRLVGIFIRSIEFELDEAIPALSIVKLNDQIRLQVEVLKTFTYEMQIQSPKLKIAEYRGKEIVKKIFESLTGDKGYELLPIDCRELYQTADAKNKNRVICDFIAGMTDKYAIEFYGRLTSENPETIFKPY